MVTVTFTPTTAIFEVEGLDKLWALRSRLELPLAHITGVRADPSVASGWWHGLRFGGTNVPGLLTAGTFYQDGGFVFWDVHDPAQTIVVDLDHEHYRALVIEVADPAQVVADLQARLPRTA
jgi:hypothetical protein